MSHFHDPEGWGHPLQAQVSLPYGKLVGVEGRLPKGGG